MEKLISGVLEFHRRLAAGRAGVYEPLAEGQSPTTLSFSCADSRVVPAFIASAEPGELFTVRNVGNIVPAADEEGHSVGDRSEASAVEFAVEKLGVTDIVVCGHSGCGAMEALQATQAELPPNLRAWLALARPCLSDADFPVDLGAENNVTDRLSKRNVLRQLTALRTYGAVAKREQAGELRLHGWWFDIRAPRIEVWGVEQQRFLPFEVYFARETR